jgi:hypothetical protein
VVDGWRLDDWTYAGRTAKLRGLRESMVRRYSGRGN